MDQLRQSIVASHCALILHGSVSRPRRFQKIGMFVHYRLEHRPQFLPEFFVHHADTDSRGAPPADVLSERCTGEQVPEQQVSRRLVLHSITKGGAHGTNTP